MFAALLTEASVLEEVATLDSAVDVSCPGGCPGGICTCGCRREGIKAAKSVAKESRKSAKSARKALK